MVSSSLFARRRRSFVRSFVRHRHVDGCINTILFLYSAANIIDFFIVSFTYLSSFVSPDDNLNTFSPLFSWVVVGGLGIFLRLWVGHVILYV